MTYTQCIIVGLLLSCVLEFFYRIAKPVTIELWRWYMDRRRIRLWLKYQLKKIY